VRWSEEEWLLVLDLFERAEKRPTDDMVSNWCGRGTRRIPGEIRIEAARIREASGLGAEMDQPPADELKSFLYDIHELIDDVVRTISVLSGSNASPDDVGAYVAGWEELNQRPLLEVISAELDAPDAILRLGDAGLLGAQLTAKLAPFRRWWAEWRSARSLESLQRALKRANVILGSLASVLPGVEALKEFKETTEAMVDEAVPRGGYLPVPAIA
jgi:hypothetical protein